MPADSSGVPVTTPRVDLHANEDLISWLTLQLASERIALQERHVQLLDQMQAKLCQDKFSQRTPIPEAKKAPDDSSDFELLNPEPANETNAAEEQNPTIDDPGQQSSVAKQDEATVAIQDTPTQDRSTVTSAASASRRQSSYKSAALRNLAGHGSGFLDENAHFLQRIVKTPQFEIVSGIAILVNTFLLAFEIEYHGFDSAHAVSYKDWRPSESTWPGAQPWFDALDVVFVTFFIVELLMRIGADGTRSVWSGWIWFDTIIVIASVVNWFDFANDAEQSNVDPTLLRIARLARMLRVLKMVRVVRAFDSLFLLIRSIMASVGVLFWSFLLMLAVVMAVGMCLSQLLRQYIQDESKDPLERKQVFLLYGTFSRAMFTVFEITLGNWVPSGRTLMDNVSEWFALFYILYCCCFIFAVVRVIQAVFITETTRVAAADDQIAILRKEKDKAIYLGKLKTMFAELDISGDGLLSREEVDEMSQDKLLKTMMTTLDINPHDLEMLFDLLDNGDGQIDIEEFIKGLSRVKGGAQSIDVVSVLKLTEKLDKKVDRILKMVRPIEPLSPSPPRTRKEFSSATCVWI